MAKILITGAGGFIGSHLSNFFADKGFYVVGVDLRYDKNVCKEHPPNFEPIAGDFRNSKKMNGWLDGVDVVFHLAAAHLQVNQDPEFYWDVNVHSLRPFLERCMQKGVKRFIHVSSVSVYGNLEKFPADELSPCNPQSIYGETKLAGEIEIMKFSQEAHFPIIILRPAWVYGPCCPRTLKLYKAIRTHRFIWIGNGENLRHPLYISDMLAAFMLAVESQSAVGETLVIGGNGAINTRKMVETFCSVFKFPKPNIKLPLSLGRIIASGSELVFNFAGKEPPFSSRSLEFFCMNNSFDISKARNLLGFAPRYSFKDGLEETKAWLENQ